MREIAKIEPTIVWEIFDEITQTPRPSSKEEKIIEWLIEFAQNNNLEWERDKVGNVLIIRPADAEHTTKERVTLQSHIDMVCEKNSNIEFDFENDPIRTRIEDGWVTATGTTLGADCGIGMALALAALIDPDLKCGEIEALFTVNEEIGLTGAKELGEGMINSKQLINLDSEEEGEICIGCAGGIDTVATFEYSSKSAPKDYTYYRIDISGLKGGHSGEDINKGRANANKILARILWEATQAFEAKVSFLHGGNLRNAIPREGYAIFGIPTRNIVEFTIAIDSLCEDIKGEWAINDPNLDITTSQMPYIDSVMSRESAQALIYSLMGVPNGVIAMSAEIEGLVETSSNLASIRFSDANSILVTTSQRSSRESAKKYISSAVEGVFLLSGAQVSHSDGYPGWTPNQESKLLSVMKECYTQQYGAEPVVKALHAGLECGLFLENYPDLDMISFGPTMYGVHSPDERLNIDSVGRCWELLKTLLVKI